MGRKRVKPTTTTATTTATTTVAATVNNTIHHLQGKQLALFFSGWL
jgi:hypothetical protein